MVHFHLLLHLWDLLFCLSNAVLVKSIEQENGCEKVFLLLIFCVIVVHCIGQCMQLVSIQVFPFQLRYVLCVVFLLKE